MAGQGLFPAGGCAQDLFLLPDHRDPEGYVQAASRGLALFALPAARTQRDRSEWQPLLHWLTAPAAAAV